VAGQWLPVVGGGPRGRLVRGAYPPRCEAEDASALADAWWFL